MKSTRILLLSGAAALGLLAGPAVQAAPLSAPAGIKVTTNDPNIQQVDYRRCWHHNGHRYCHYYAYDDYDGDYGPGLGFYFGGGGRGWHGGHGGFHGGHIGGHGGGHHR